MEICAEMQKLRKMLDNKGIEWHDVSEDCTRWICRTHFDIGDGLVSVINGAGSYGGFFYEPNSNNGLLEIMSYRINHGEPVGYLTAEEVMELITENYEV